MKFILISDFKANTFNLSANIDLGFHDCMPIGELQYSLQRWSIFHGIIKSV